MRALILIVLAAVVAGGIYVYSTGGFGGSEEAVEHEDGERHGHENGAKRCHFKRCCLGRATQERRQEREEEDRQFGVQNVDKRPAPGNTPVGIARAVG